MAGLALFALLLMAPAAAGASTVVNEQRHPVVLAGDASADRVQLTRYVDTRNERRLLVPRDRRRRDHPAVALRPRVSSTMAACRDRPPGRGYQLNTGGGADTVDDPAGAPRRHHRPRPGQRHLHRPARPPTSSTAATATTSLRGAGGNDQLFGDGGNDQVAGQTGNDVVDGGAGDDQLEFGGAGMPADAGAGADDIRGGAGSTA